MNKKYKPCCGRRCLVLGCKSQEAGACYCLCRLIDQEFTIKALLNGTSYAHKGGIIYEPSRTPSPLTGDEKQEREKQLESVREKIKTYEL